MPSSAATRPGRSIRKEAFALYRDHLRPRGSVALNFIGNHLDPGQRGALETVVSAARAVFPTVDVYPDPWEPGKSTTRNLFIVASRAPRRERLHPGDAESADIIKEALARSRPVEVVSG